MSVKNSRNLKGYLRVPVYLLLLIAALQLSGCGAVQTSVSKKDLDVQTKMSDTIFLEPVSPAKRIIYIDIRNSSDKTLPIEPPIMAAIQNSGFTITDDPELANFMLQANVLSAGKADLRNATDAADAGFGGALIGATLAGSGSHSDTQVAAGLLGAFASIAADAMVKDVVFTMVTDIQIRERPSKGESVVQNQSTSASQGTATTLNQSASGGEVNWKTYRTRIVSTANKANLTFPEAQPELISGLVRTISGIF